MGEKNSVEKWTLREKLSYFIDRQMSKGITRLFSWLLFFTLVLIFIFAFIAMLATGSGMGQLLHFVWMSFLRTLDPGTMGGDEGNRLFLLSMLLATITGIFVTSMLIGIINEGIRARVEKMQRGSSKVLEKGHIVILGWSEKIYTLLRELDASESGRTVKVAVMSEMDTLEMEETIRRQVGKLRKLRILCRTGNPVDQKHLEILSIENARSVIVLSGNNPDSDSGVVKILLALAPIREKAGVKFSLVADIKDDANREIAQMAGQGKAEIVFESKMLAGMLVQTCCQPGLSYVYNDFLNFSGNEFYFVKAAPFVGRPFIDVIFQFANGIPMGIRRYDGSIVLGPEKSMRISGGDDIIVLAASGSSMKYHNQPNFPDIKEQESVIEFLDKNEIGKILVMGWNDKIPDIVNEMNDYLPEGTDVWMMSEHPGGQEFITYYLRSKGRVNFHFYYGCVTSRTDITAVLGQGIEHVLVLSDEKASDWQQADARTIAALLHLRDVSSKTERKFTISTEMQDSLNERISSVSRADDYIVSPEMVSMLMAQLAIEPRLAPVFEELFNSDGKEIYIKHLQNYGSMGMELPFDVFLKNAWDKYGEIAIGYYHKKAEGDIPLMNINPSRRDRFLVEEGAYLVVIADNFENQT